MIFVTVGTQLPFDRLVKAVDAWAGAIGRTDVVAQIGPTQFQPSHIRWVRFMDPAEMEAMYRDAELIVSHAGIGSMLKALELGKPIVVMPRMADLGEQRNDHQLATVESFSRLGYVEVARDEDELRDVLSRGDVRKPRDRIGPHASPELLGRLRGFILEKATPMGPDLPCDGVVCFGGEDWWYHNRGHYDIQMMRRLSGHFPVLYINSIGVRPPTPAEGAMFFRRVKRKLLSITRGLKRVERRFFVYSPFIVPGFSTHRIMKWLLLAQIRRALRVLGMRSPLVWVAVPSAEPAARRIARSLVVYQRTDSFENFPGVDRAKILAHDAGLKRWADLTLFCSTFLYEKERGECRDALYVDHGVDYRMFASTENQMREPSDLALLPRPRIGFVGGMDAHTFDPDFFLDVASRLPDCSFAMVGASSLPKGWCTLSNVHFLGRKEYPQVPAYMAGCDVLIMPWRKNDWIRACNPVKTKEYLAAGRPVVSTYFQEIEKYRDHVSVADTASGFAQAVRECITAAPDPARLQAVVRGETWENKASRIIGKLKDIASAAIPSGKDR